MDSVAAKQVRFGRAQTVYGGNEALARRAKQV